jgi:uroporphyrin-III C-methyltransferase
MRQTPEPLEAFGGPPAAPGTVALVGAGPGDPGLLTLRAVRLLSTCDVVAYDHLAPQEVLALAPERAERVCVGRRAGGPSVDRRDADELLVSRAKQGRAVVRLKGGDPYVFGRGGLEAQLCRAAGVPCEVVAGVTSAVAVPGAAGIPVTHRSVAPGFAVVTAHEAAGETVDYDALARFPGTLVFMMGVAHVRRVAERLVAHGKSPDTPVALVRWGTTAEQETLEATLATVADEVERRGFAAPAVTVVGDVVALRHGLPSREEQLSPMLAAGVRTVA